MCSACPPQKPRLENLLERCAHSSAGLTFYPVDENAAPERVEYHDLHNEVVLKAHRLSQYAAHMSHQIVLLHFDRHRDNVVWFWAVLYAGFVPAMSTPLVKDAGPRAAHLDHLHRMLLDPLVITSPELRRSDFADNALLHVVTDVQIDQQSRQDQVEESSRLKRGSMDDAKGDGVRSPMTEEQRLSNGSGRSARDHRGHKRQCSANGKPVNQTNGYFHTTADSKHSNGHSNGPANGHSNGYQNGSANGHHNGDINGHETEHWDSSQDASVDARMTSLKDVAALMLTSGSTGNAKAVCLTHEQILTACRGKLEHMPMPPSSAVLNWIGLDHVGSLVELHIAGLMAQSEQVHVPANRMIVDPLYFLRLLSKHHIVRTFAPNFFLHKLQQALASAAPQDVSDIDLKNLLHLISGGEANNVDVCVAVSKELQNFGAPTATTIKPGFGMTETCAGCIYSRSCPKADVAAGTEFAALGTCVSGIEMRIEGAKQPNDAGELQVRGEIVFARYFNNRAATEEAFTADGWFRTGDTATISGSGILRIVGRTKETIIVNGVKYLPHEIESAIEQANISGVAASSAVCFAHRAAGASTEEVYVVYQISFDEADSAARMTALQGIVRTVVLMTGSRPKVLPLPPGRLQRTTLGKLSRAKIRSSLQQSEYSDEQVRDAQMLRAYRERNNAEPHTDAEHRMLRIFRELELGSLELGVNTGVLEAGVTSVDLVRLRKAAEVEFGIPEIPLVTMMTNSTVRALAAAVARLQSRHQASGDSNEAAADYDPVVVLQPHGHKTPLWLLHPGIGEILVFLGLVAYFPDRPMYALRARGLNRGEPVFSGLDEVLDVYHAAIRARQPHGPYALAGYSYGSMLAFELTKRLTERDGEAVRFLGSFNLPPHIKTRMRRLDWTAGLLHIAHFCAIISEARSEELTPELRPRPHAEQIRRLLAESDPVRCAELALDGPTLHNWTDVSWSLQQIGWEYEPSGAVADMDVFYCQPLKDVAASREEYRRDHLNHWADFVEGDLKFWEVDGRHYTMIGAEHVGRFQATLKQALAARGI